MANYSNTSRPAYVWDGVNNQWVPVGVGPHTHSVADVANAVSNLGGSNIVNTTATTVPLTITGASSQSADLLDVKNSAGTVVANIDANGSFSASNYFVAGKNKIINGDFGIWQRGTSFSSTGYTADRFYLIAQNTCTLTQQTFTPGTAPVAGYEGTYYAQYARTSSSSDDYIIQRLENIRTFSGQTVTISFWAKADTATTISQLYCGFNAGSGGSGAPSGVGNLSGISITTSWARYSTTFTMPSMSGVTIGTGSFVELTFKLAAAMGNRTISLWGLQFEAGSVATPFTTASNTLQGELALCQRYYNRIATGTNIPICNASVRTGSLAEGCINFPTMRTTPTLDTVSGSGYYYFSAANNFTTFTNLNIDLAGASSAFLYTSGISGLTAGQGGYFYTNNSSAYLGFTAEL